MTKQDAVVEKKCFGYFWKDAVITGLSFLVFLSDIIWRVLTFVVVTTFLFERGVTFSSLESKMILVTGLVWMMYSPLDRLVSFLRHKEVRDAIQRRKQ